jgi:large subunit ribosomal protein L24e
VLIQTSKDSTIEFEKRRNIPVRYDRELMQTTIATMKRVAEIKKKREHAFWRNRYTDSFCFQGGYSNLTFRMTIAKEKQRAHRQKTLERIKNSSVKLVQPESSKSAIRQKIKVASAQSALLPGEGRSMTMDID